MKKVLTILLTLALCLSLFVVAAAEEDDPIVIGQVFWGLHDSYQHAHQVQTQKYCDELGIEYIPIDGQMKPEVQAAGMEDLIARGVDGIICQAYDQASMELSIQAAQDAGIPVVSFVNVSSGDVLYPSVEMAEEAGAIEMGRIVGEKFKENFPDTNVKLVTISDPSVEWAHNQRTMAFVRGLQEVFPDLEHVFNGGKSDREIAYSTVEDVLQRDPEVNVIFVTTRRTAWAPSPRWRLRPWPGGKQRLQDGNGRFRGRLHRRDPQGHGSEFLLCGYAGPAAERERPRLRGHDAQGHQRRNRHVRHHPERQDPLVRHRLLEHGTSPAPSSSCWKVGDRDRHRGRVGL